MPEVADGGRAPDAHGCAVSGRRPGAPHGRGAPRIAELGLRAVIDLRQKAQYDRGYFFDDEDITHHIPTVDRVIDVENPPRFEETADIVGLYEDMVVRGGPQLVRAVDTVAEYIADGPVLVHCVAGKDRTGLVVALVQAALGVP